MDGQAAMRTRRPALGLLLVVALLLPLPGGQGQVVSQLTNPHEDTTYGWSFPEDHLARATVDDDDADMSAGVLMMTTALPVESPIARAVEITALHIDEVDSALLRVRLEVAELDAVALQREQTWSGIAYAFGFELAGHRYRLSGELRNSCTSPEDTTCENLGALGMTYRPEISRFTEGRRSDALGIAPSRVLEDENAIEVLVPRHLTLTDGPGHPGAGSVLQDAWAQSRTTHVLYDSWRDDVGSSDSTGVLRLTRDAYGSQVVLSTQPPKAEEDEIEHPSGANLPPIEPRRERVDVTEDMPARVPLHVTNVLDRKIIVVPQVTVTSGGNGHTVRAPEALEIAAGATRRIELLVNGTDPLDPEDPLVVTVQVRPLGLSSDVGDRLDVIVRSVPRLSPDAPRLYLHASEPQNGLWVGDVKFGGFYNGYLSTLAVDTTGPAEEAFLASNCLCPTAFGWQATSALASPAILDLARDGKLHLQIDAPTAGEYRVAATVVYAGDSLGSGVTEISLGAGETTVEVPLLFTAQTPRLEPGGFFELDIDARFTSLPGGITMWTTEQDAPRVQLQGGSYVEFPLDEAPVAVQTADHLVVAVGAGYDAYQYVNPGRTTLWNVTVLNQGSDNDTVTIDAKADSPEWKLRIAPGSAYRIGPGESVTVGILATAPDDAAEESHVMVNVSATSKLANGKGATMTVRAIVTSGVQLPDVIYAPDNETSARVADLETKDSPGTPSLVTVLAVLGVVLTGRRRRA